MPQGDKSSYTNKQKRQAGHIEKSYEKRGVGKKEAEERAWRTVNKETGGGKKGGRKAKAKSKSKSSSKTKAKRGSRTRSRSKR